MQTVTNLFPAGSVVPFVEAAPVRTPKVVQGLPGDDEGAAGTPAAERKPRPGKGDQDKSSKTGLYVGLGVGAGVVAVAGVALGLAFGLPPSPSAPAITLP